MLELSELLMVEIFAELEKLGKYAFRGMGSEKKFAMAQRIAKKVEELGYVKVVRCEECKGRWTCGLKGLLSYCSGGEAKEGANA